MGIIKKIVNRVRSDYGYYKLGRKTEFDQENAATKKKNMQRLKGDIQAYHENRG